MFQGLQSVFDDYIFTRMAKILNDFVNQILNFCENYLFCIVATGLWIKIILGIFTGHPPGLIIILLAIISTALAITMGAVFW